MQPIGVGVKSGKDVDKFESMHLTKESPVSVECKVKEIKEFGSHHMFIAEVLCINADDKYVNEKGAFDIGKCNLITYANGGYYNLNKKIGKFGFSVEKKKNAKKSRKK